MVVMKMEYVQQSDPYDHSNSRMMILMIITRLVMVTKNFNCFSVFLGNTLIESTFVDGISIDTVFLNCILIYTVFFVNASIVSVDDANDNDSDNVRVS